MRREVSDGIIGRNICLFETIRDTAIDHRRDIHPTLEICLWLKYSQPIGYFPPSRNFFSSIRFQDLVPAQHSVRPHGVVGVKCEEFNKVLRTSSRTIFDSREISYVYDGAQ